MSQSAVRASSQRPDQPSRPDRNARHRACGAINLPRANEPPGWTLGRSDPVGAQRPPLRICRRRKRTDFPQPA